MEDRSFKVHLAHMACHGIVDVKLVNLGRGSLAASLGPSPRQAQ